MTPALRRACLGVACASRRPVVKGGLARRQIFMTRGASGAAWPQVRKGLIAHTKLMLSSFDTTGFRAMLAALENGEEVGLDGGSLGLVLGTIDPSRPTVQP